MKKIICFVLCLLMCMTALAPALFASAEEKDEFFGAADFSCSYNDKNSRVHIDGTISHDFMVKHSDYKIGVYAAAVDQTPQDVMSDPNKAPLAQSAMSIRFTFYINVDSILGQHSGYFIVLISPDGKKHLATASKLPTVASDFSYDPNKREEFKGILDSNSAHITDSGAGRVIVDVDLELIVGIGADSILYPMRGSYIHIRKTYVDAIDKQVRAASLTGSSVYLRYIMKTEDGERYKTPNVYSKDMLEYIYTVTDFFATRYNGGKKGSVCGIVAGTRIDDVETVNDIGIMTVEEYAKLYTLYLAVIGGSARRVNGSFDIVIPLSDRNDYSSGYYESNAIRGSVLLEQISKRLSENVSADFDCSVLVESDMIPFDANAESIENGIDTANADLTRLGAYNLADIVVYINALSKKYPTAPSNVSYMWSVPEEINESLTCAIYSYSYFKLASMEKVASFVVNIDGADAYRHMETLLKYIDTERVAEVTDGYARYFGANSWKELFEDKYTSPLLQSINREEFFEYSSGKFLSSFCYMSFDQTDAFEIMNCGEGFKTIRPEYDGEGVKTMYSLTDPMKLGQSAEIMGRFEYAESYEHTPFMSLKLKIDGKGASQNALYEVTLVLGQGSERLETVGVVSQGELEELFFDSSVLSSNRLVDYIRIRVRCVTEPAEEVSLMVYELNGYSLEHDESTLAELISGTRTQLRDQSADGGGDFDYTTVIIIVSIIIVAIVIGVGLVLIFRRNDTLAVDSNQKS